MRGPFERLKYDLRRLWECPKCKRRERTPGQVSSQFCRCTVVDGVGTSTCMLLLEPDGHRTVPPVVLQHNAADYTVPPSAISEGDVSSPETSATDTAALETPDSPPLE